MTHVSPTLRRAGFLCFALGIFLSILLTGALVWPDLEASFYGFAKLADKPLNSLSCPALLTPLDRGQVKISLHNPLKKVIAPRIKVQLSAPFTIITLTEQIELQPGERKALSWEIGPENIDLERFIFARVFIYPVSSLKMQEATCGTLVLNLPFAGGPAIFWAVVGLAAFGAGFGLWLWQRSSNMTDPRIAALAWRMRFLALFIGLGVAAGIFGWWFFGMLALLVTLLMLSVLLMVSSY